MIKKKSIEELKNIFKKVWNGISPIYWLDLHFRNSCIESLPKILENFNGPKEIKIITGLSIIRNDTHDCFKKVKLDLEKKGITIDLKVLVDQKEMGKYHDRWLLNERVGFNLMPLGAIIQGKEGDLFELTEEQLKKRLKSLQVICTKSFDVLEKFKEIQKEAANLAWKQSVKNVIYANLGEPLKNIIQKMLKKDISQLPVRNEKKEIIGAITEEILNRLLVADEANVEEPLELKHIAPLFPVLEEKDFDEFLKIANLLYYYPAVLLKKNNKISIMTKADILKYWRLEQYKDKK